MHDTQQSAGGQRRYPKVIVKVLILADRWPEKAQLFSGHLSAKIKTLRAALLLRLFLFRAALLMGRTYVIGSQGLGAGCVFPAFLLHRVKCHLFSRSFFRDLPGWQRAQIVRFQHANERWIGGHW